MPLRAVFFFIVPARLRDPPGPSKSNKQQEQGCISPRNPGAEMHLIGVEPITYGSEDRCSVQLSYRCLFPSLSFLGPQIQIDLALFLNFLINRLWFLKLEEE